MHLPDDISSSAATTHPTQSIWTAICNDDRRFRWKIPAHRAIGKDNLRRWVLRIIGTAGYPVRIQHFDLEGGALLVEALIWDSGDELEDDFGAAEEIHGFGLDVIGRDHQCCIEGPGPASAIERGITMLIERPETVLLVVRSVIELVESMRSPDELALARIQEGASDAAAAAVENKIADLLRKAGYRVGEDGGLQGPDDADPDFIEVDDSRVAQDAEDETDTEDDHDAEDETDAAAEEVVEVELSESAPTLVVVEQHVEAG